MNQSWVIYGLHLERNNQIRYIGYTTTTLKNRLYQHNKHAWRTDVPKDTPLRAWMRKHGEKVVISVIEQVEQGNEELLYQREIYWIANYREKIGRRLLNVANGGIGGAPGRKLSDVHKLAIKNGLATSEKMKNRKNYHTPESRAKMSASHKGVPLTAKTRETMSDGRRKGENHHYFGKKRDPEVVEKIRIANTGRTASEEIRKKISEGNKGVSRASGHTRYHVGRGVYNENCKYCNSKQGEKE